MFVPEKKRIITDSLKKKKQIQRFHKENTNGEKIIRKIWKHIAFVKNKLF